MGLSATLRKFRLDPKVNSSFTAIYPKMPLTVGMLASLK